MLARDRQAGDERDRQPAGDQRQADRGVAGPVVDVGLEAAELAAGAPCHQLPCHARMPGGPRLVVELGERRVAEFVRQREVHGVVEQLVALQPAGQPQRLVLPLVAEDEVDVAERERGERLLGLGLDELGAQPRRGGPQGRHRRDRELERDRLERRDARAAGDRPGGGGQVGLGPGGAVQQRLRVAHQHERGVRQAHAAPGLLEQRDAGLALEQRELLRDGARRELERVGDRGDRPALVQLFEQAQAAQFEHVAKLPLHR
jgi:hypothetical protein